MAGQLVDQARAMFVGALKPKPSPPLVLVLGTEAALTKNVPPSPIELGLTISAAPSFSRKARYRFCCGKRPRKRLVPLPPKRGGPPGASSPSPPAGRRPPNPPANLLRDTSPDCPAVERSPA